MRLRPLRSVMMWGLIPLGIFLLVWGKEYTGLTCFALASASWADKVGKSDLLLMPRFYAFLLFVTALIFVFNGYLTARPVVLYGRAYQMDLRVWTIPIEDFFYGHSLVIWVTVLLERFKAQRPPSAIYASTHRII
jgi:lycopene cyclase domain-containing protein